MARGRFITFEGGEGAGKSTQTRALADWLRTSGRTVVQTREPGGSPAAERVRSALLGLPPEDGEWQASTECLLHYAARVQHVADVIEPALAAGSWVISDRFADSTMAYQGHAGNLGLDRVRSLDVWALGGLAPDLTLLLDLPVEAGLDRVRTRGAEIDVYERRPAAFHEAVRQGFLAIAKAEPERCRLIDATATPGDVAGAIQAAVIDRFGPV